MKKNNIEIAVTKCDSDIPSEVYVNGTKVEEVIFYNIQLDKDTIRYIRRKDRENRNNA